MLAIVAQANNKITKINFYISIALSILVYILDSLATITKYFL